MPLGLSPNGIFLTHELCTIKIPPTLRVLQTNSYPPICPKLNNETHFKFIFIIDIITKV